MTFRVGDIVKYRTPQDGEAHLRFEVLEDNGDRILIASLDFPQYRIRPLETVSTRELVKVKQ